MGDESRKLGVGSEKKVKSKKCSVTVVSGEFGDESRELRLLFFYELEPTSTQSSLYQLI